MSTIESQAELDAVTIEEQIRSLEWRDWQLWSLALIALLIIFAGFLALLAPQAVWHLNTALVREQNLPVLLVGLVCLLVLLNAYLFRERRVLLATRRRLIVRLQNAERRAHTDALTGVYNRRFMDDALKREIERAKRNGSNWCIMLADVDNFKDFNTKFGHVVGDRILVEVAILLQKNFRAADLIIRYGGDEFLVIMPDTNLAQGAVAIDRLQGLLRRWNDKEHRDYTLSLSCGVSMYSPGDELETVIHAADADLYVRKAGVRAPVAQSGAK